MSSSSDGKFDYNSIKDKIEENAKKEKELKERLKSIESDILEIEKSEWYGDFSKGHQLKNLENEKAKVVMQSKALKDNIPKEHKDIISYIENRRMLEKLNNFKERAKDKIDIELEKMGNILSKYDIKEKYQGIISKRPSYDDLVSELSRISISGKDEDIETFKRDKKSIDNFNEGLKKVHKMIDAAEEEAEYVESNIKQVRIKLNKTNLDKDIFLEKSEFNKSSMKEELEGFDGKLKGLVKIVEKVKSKIIEILTNLIKKKPEFHKFIEDYMRKENLLPKDTNIYKNLLKEKLENSIESALIGTTSDKKYIKNFKEELASSLFEEVKKGIIAGQYQVQQSRQAGKEEPNFLDEEKLKEYFSKYVEEKSKMQSQSPIDLKSIIKERNISR